MSFLIRTKEPDIASSREKKAYEIYDENDILLELEYDNDLRTTRVTSGNARRIFIVDVEGKLQKRTVLKNEYGFEMGHITPSPESPSHGKISLNGKQYDYNLDAGSDELVINEKINSSSAMSLHLEPGIKKLLGLPLHNKFLSINVSCLCMCLCWFMQSGIAKSVRIG